MRQAPAAKLDHRAHTFSGIIGFKGPEYASFHALSLNDLHRASKVSSSLRRIKISALQARALMGLLQKRTTARQTVTIERRRKGYLGRYAAVRWLSSRVDAIQNSSPLSSSLVGVTLTRTTSKRAPPAGLV